MRQLLIFISAAAALAAANTSFHSPQSYITQSEPLGVLSGDLNGDGKPDLIVINLENTVQTFLGNGSGSFHGHSTVGIPLPIAYAMGDFNGDGKLDVAIASEDGRVITVLLGDGNGGFSSPATTSLNLLPTSMAVGDVNGDGILDVVIGSFESNQVGVLLGNGDGTFKPPQFIASGVAGTQIQLADLNHDGKLDVGYLSGTSGPSTVMTQLGNGDGTFGAPASFTIAGTTNTTTFAFADLDGDGTLDVVVSGYAGSSWQAYVGHGNGNGTFSLLGGTPLPTAPTNLVIGDFNEDGHPDVAGNGSVSSGGGDLMVLLGNGSGSFSAPLIFASDGTGPLATGDWNSDGHLDLVLANTFQASITTPMGDGHGHFTAPVRPNLAPSPVNAVAADVNGDGKMDLVVVNQNTLTSLREVSILPGKGNGSFGTPVVLKNVGQVPAAVAVADFNHDGIPDLVVTDTHIPAGVRVLLGNGGSFRAPVFYSSAPGSAVVAADVNGDGAPDIVVLDTNQAKVSVLLGNGDGTFQAALDFSAGINPVAMVTGDFNRDGHLDLALADESGNAVSIMFGNGDGTFQSPVTAAIVQQPHSIVAADFNGDGNTDLAVSSLFSGAMEYLAGNGNGTFVAPLSYYPLKGTAFELVAADVNGDGLMDVVCAAAGGAQFSTMLGNGAGGFGATTAFDAGSSAALALSADFNGDGKPDLAFIGGLPGQPYTLTVVLNTSH